MGAEDRRHLGLADQDAHAVGAHIRAPRRQERQHGAGDTARQAVDPVNEGQHDRYVQDGKDRLCGLDCRVGGIGEDIRPHDQHEAQKQRKEQPAVPAEPDRFQIENSAHKACCSDGRPSEFKRAEHLIKPNQRYHSGGQKQHQSAAPEHGAGKYHDDHAAPQADQKILFLHRFYF